MKISYSIFLSLLCLSCIAQKKLVPVEFKSFTDSPPYSAIQSDGITMIVECLEVRKDLIVFDIEIKNDSESPFRLDPETFYYYESDHPFPDYHDPDWEDQYPYPHYAQSQSSIDQYLRRKVRSGKTAKTILAIVGSGLVVYDAIKDGQDFYSEPTPGRVKKSINRDVTVASSLAAIDIADHVLTEKQISNSEDLHYLQREYLFPTSLDPGDSVRGKVFFTYSKNNYYRLVTPIKYFYFVFDFRWPDAKERRDLRRY